MQIRLVNKGNGNVGNKESRGSCKPNLYFANH